MTSIEILIGHNLPDHYVERMNQQRITEYSTNTKNFRRYELQSLFFFLHDDNQLRAFGMLKPVTLCVGNTQIPILGIGNIIAIDKKQGYGKQLMHHIKDHLQAENRIGMGFCSTKVAGFYASCGYQIINDLSGRFRYLYADQDGKLADLGDSPPMLCYDPTGTTVDRLIQTDQPVYIDVPFW